MPNNFNYGVCFSAVGRIEMIAIQYAGTENAFIIGTNYGMRPAPNWTYGDIYLLYLQLKRDKEFWEEHWCISCEAAGKSLNFELLITESNPKAVLIIRNMTDGILLERSEHNIHAEEPTKVLDFLNKRINRYAKKYEARA